MCAEEDIEFVLGHALLMRAIHGAKTKNDRVDSEKIARLTAAREAYPQACVIRRSIPGVGKIITLTILLEVGDISRFQSRQAFYSHCRLANPRAESAGKSYGT